MNANGIIAAEGELSAIIIRADGSHRDADTYKSSLDVKEQSKKLIKPLSFWKKLYTQLRHSNAIPAAMGLAGFIHWIQSGDATGIGAAIVTTAGINYLAADFLASSTNHIANFNYHDSGTGSTAAATSDTALVTQAGPTTRSTGTQSTPSSGQYRSVGTISYTSTLTIAEWGLFSQSAQGGTLWDRRVVGPYTMNNGDAIQWTYNLTVNAGGS
jgi:hypothetical protein